VLLGTLAMVWPGMAPRIGVVVASVVLILAQTQLPRFRSVERVSGSD
jgi:hypothetical protein